jgi:phosphohistidine phosphatase
MRTFILTRHAKSDWGDISKTDFERTLNTRGLHDAPMMGKRLLERGLPLDLIVSSTAIRAKQTALGIAKAIGYPENAIQWYDNLYHAPPSEIQQVINSIDTRFQHILLVGHNNGITDFANSICGHITDNMPTCSMIGFETEADEWSDMPKAESQVLFYDYPKRMG